LAAIVLAAPAVPVAVKVTGLPVDTEAEAVTVLVPEVVPSVQLVRLAIPLELVFTMAGLLGRSVPPPAVREKVTAIPATPFPLTSVTFTDGGALTAVPTVALCVVAEFAIIAWAAAAVPVAVKVTGDPLGTEAAAVTVLAPALGPSVQLVSVAIPLVLVLITAGLTGLSVPPPDVSVKVIATPDFGFPLASVTLTEGGAATAVPTVAFCVVTLLAAIVFAAPAVPEAVNVTGLPLRPVAVAVTVLLLVPAVGPSVQLVAVATPLALVETVVGPAGTTVPPPAVTAKVTCTPATGLFPASVTFTDGGAVTAVATVALCVVTLLAAIVVAPPVVPEAVKVTGLPLNPAAVAVTMLLLVPDVGPRVQLVAVAIPETFVITVVGLAGTTVPPPAVTANVTATPATGLPLPSVTLTEGGAATAVPTVAL